MDQGPLVNEQIEVGARFLSEFEHFAPVQVAAWLKVSDSNYWNLYIVSDQIDDANFDKAYTEVARITRQLQNPWIEFRVKVLIKSEKTALALLDLQKRTTGRIPPWWLDRRLGDVFVDEAYLYPPMAPVTI
jgi:hypothetical protein